MLKWAAFLLGLAMAAPAAAALTPAWVEMTPSGAQARAVVEGWACPSLAVDGRRRAMRLRAGPEADFPNRICEARLPKGARRVSLAGSPLPVPKPRPMRLVIFGDSGCRIVKGLVQNCNDAVAGWPFARVARLAAAQMPDLVIHLGDYYYREAPCPPATEACADSPYGDRWPTWKAELFDPAARLLQAAPWIFVRGNHEDCRRGGAGWFRLLDTDAAARTCPARSDPFTLDLGGVRLAFLDSADPDDNRRETGAAEAFARDLAQIPAGPEPVWLVTHRPLWALSHHLFAIGGDWGNVNLREGARAQGLKGVSLIIGGHVHNFTSLDFGAERPPTLIVGTGGDAMDPRDPHRPLSLELLVDGVKAQAITTGEFGYFVLDRAGADWMGAFHDLDDRVTVRCRLHGARLNCTPVGPPR